MLFSINGLLEILIALRDKWYFGISKNLMYSLHYFYKFIQAAFQMKKMLISNRKDARSQLINCRIKSLRFAETFDDPFLVIWFVIHMVQMDGFL